jgi:hypothetical protein
MKKPAPAFVEKNPLYEAAKRFRDNPDPKDGVNYSWVSEYAKALWEYRNGVFDKLDEKSESIIKYLGGGTGLFTLGVLAKIDAGNGNEVDHF